MKTMDPEKLEALAETAYLAYWERVTPKYWKITPFNLHAEPYKEDWRRVTRTIISELPEDKGAKDKKKK